MRFRSALWILLACLIATSSANADDDRPDPTSPDARVSIQRFAANPEIVTPTGIAVEASGRVLVIECHTHFRPEGYAGPKADRILAMTDTNGDGVADKITTFFEGTEATMNLAVYEDGSGFVATRMEVFRLADTDGDGRADKNTPIVRMETKGNYPHNGLSGFAFDGLGNVYFGLGENLGADYRLVGTDGAALSGGGEGGSIYRCRADGSELTRVATGFWNPFHLCFDAYDRLFAVDNDPDSRPPCRLLHVVQGGDYGYRFRNGRKGIHPFTAWNGELPGTLPMTAGTGEAPSGMLSYDSDLLPEEFRGTLLSTSWGDHRIERFRLEPRGASFRSVAVAVISGGENFRPVGLALAPDGSLFASDWVDKSYPLHGKGAVWHFGAKEEPSAARPTDPREAILSLDRPTRQRAARRLAQADLPAAEQAANQALLTKVALGDAAPEIRADALLGLARMKHGTAAARAIALAEGTAGLRSLAVRLMKEDPATFAQLAAASQPAEVRAEAVRRLNAKLAEPLLFTALAENDPFVRSAAHSALAATSSVANQIHWTESDRPEVRLGAVLLLRQSNDVKAQAALARLLADADPLVRFAAVQWVAESKLTQYRPQIVAGLQKGATTRQLFEASLAALDRLDSSKRGPEDESSGDKFVLRLLADRTTSSDVRARAIRSIRPENPELTTATLLELLGAEDLPTRLEVVRTLRQRDDATARNRVAQLAADAEMPERLRAEAIVGVTPDTAARRELLLALTTDKRPALRHEALRSLRGVELSEAERAQIAAVGGDKTDAELVRMLLGQPASPAPPPRQDLEAWDKLMAAQGDAAAGERIYHHPRGPGCYRCHSVDGRGGEIGPDLSMAARVLTGRRLLESLLDPSKEVAPQFSVWNVVRTDGTTISGVLLGEQADGSRQYGLAQGNVVSLKADEVAETHAAKGSVMPENLLELLAPGELSDLLAYLRTPK